VIPDDFPDSHVVISAYGGLALLGSALLIVGGGAGGGAIQTADGSAPPAYVCVGRGGLTLLGEALAEIS